MRAFAMAAVLVAASALPAAAQSVSIDLGAAGGPGNTSRLVQLTALIGLLSLAPETAVLVLPDGRASRPTRCWSGWRCSSPSS